MTKPEKPKNRVTRSIKISNSAWDRLEVIATLAGRTRGDLLNAIFEQDYADLQLEVLKASKQAKKSELLKSTENDTEKLQEFLASSDRLDCRYQHQFLERHQLIKGVDTCIHTSIES